MQTTSEGPSAPHGGVRARFALRAGLRRVTSSAREAECGVRCVQRLGELCALDVVMSKERRLRWRGVMLCGHIWTCPVCSEKLRAEKAEQVADALEGSGGRWQMVTFTVRHHVRHAAPHVLDVLRRAWRRLKSGGAVQRIMRARVGGSIRAYEVTYGENGWHFHVHVLWRTTQWSDEERAKLLDRWLECVNREDPTMVPDYDHGVRWSHPIDASHADERKRARYVAKLGLEIVGVGKWERSVWSVAQRAVRGDKRAGHLWREFAAATRGARMIEMDERAVIFAARARAARALATENDGDVEASEVVTILIDRTELQLLRAAERRDERFLARLCVALSVSDDPRTTFELHLRAATVLVGSARGGDGGSKKENDDGREGRHREDLHVEAGEAPHVDSVDRRRSAACGEASP